MKDTWNAKDGDCMIFAELFTKKLLKDGVKDFKVHEGYVIFEGENVRFEHTWIKLADGILIDETVSQFSKEFDTTTISYLEYNSYTPKRYLKLCKRYPTPPPSFKDFEERYSEKETNLLFS